MALNFVIVDGGTYKDWSGAPGTYSYDGGSRTIVFQGAALAGQAATYDPGRGTASNPATVTFKSNGDGCEWKR